MMTWRILLIALIATYASLITTYPSIAKDCAKVTDNILYCDEASWPAKTNIGGIDLYRSEDYTHFLSFVETSQELVDNWTIEKHIANYIESPKVALGDDGITVELIEREPISIDGNEGTKITYLWKDSIGNSSVVATVIPFEGLVLVIETSVFGGNHPENLSLHASVIANVTIGDAP